MSWCTDFETGLPNCLHIACIWTRLTTHKPSSDCTLNNCSDCRKAHRVKRCPFGEETHSSSFCPDCDPLTNPVIVSKKK